jgi:DNA gyrase/topoisomerase IV subunit A
MEIRREIFGDVHMAMHWSGEQSLKLKQRMARQEEMTGELQQQLKAAKLDRRTLQKENQRLRAKQTRLKAALAAAEKDKSLLAQTLSAPQDRQEENRHELEEIKRENRDLKNRLDILLKGSEEKQRQINLLEGKNGRLREELERQRESIQGFTEEARKNIGQIFALNRCDTTCPSFDLCKKRILIVGGITRMESLYRELIEGCGGVFEYHDGYMKKGTKGLENRLRRADMVVCPVSCNSHAACSIVKNLAKKHNKTVHMLPNSSLSAVSQAIWGGGDQATIN